LSAAKFAFEKQGQRNVGTIVKTATNILETEPRIQIEYIDVCDTNSGGATSGHDETITKTQDSKIMISGAMKLGKTRLIDNVLLD
jgi:pantothenate synthetase